MNYPVDYFTGTGTTTTFNLSFTPASATSILVYISGVKQVSATGNPAYFVNGSQLIFTAAPGPGSPIEVAYLGIYSQVNVPSSQSITTSMLALQVSNTFITQAVADGTSNTITLVAPPISANSLLVTANGVVQYDYTVANSTVQLNFVPPVGTFLRVQAFALAQNGVPNDGSVTTAKLAPNLSLSGNTTFLGSVGFGTASVLSSVGININKTITGATTSYAMRSVGQVQSDVTGNARYYATAPSTQATAFTLNSLTNYYAEQGTLGAGSVVNNQFGFFAESSLTGATNNYGFYGNIASGTGRYNFYAAGTADNYFAGNVGIGTSSPSQKLQIANGNIYFSTTNFLMWNSGGSYAIDSDASTRLSFYSGSGTERMRIDNAGNVNIGALANNNVFDQVGGARPFLVQKSDTSTTIAGSLASITISNGDTTTNNTAQINFATITGASTNQYSGATISAVFGARTNGTYPAGQLVFSTSTATTFAPTEKMRIDSSGNVGIGVTPSAWNNTYKAMQVGFGASIYGRTASSTAAITSNAFVNSGGSFQYINTEAASYYLQGGGQHLWNYAASGTAGNTITFSEAMRLDTSGNLGIGTSSPSSKLNVQGTTGNNVFISQIAGATNNPYLSISHSESGSYSKIDANGSTVAASNLVLSTLGNERMRIDSSGNVGVGGTATANGAGYVTLGVNGTTAGIIEWKAGGVRQAQGYATTSQLALGSTTAIPFLFTTNNAEAMRIDSSGNVGIGTSSPGQKLDVNGSAYFGPGISTGTGLTTGDALLELGGLRTGSGPAYLDLHSTASTDYEARILRNTGVNGTLQIVNTGTGDFQLQGTGAAPITFLTNSTERMRIDSAGNLLVGAASSSTLPTGYVSAANTFGFKNRIINGDGAIYQRASAAALTTTASYLSCDRWFAVQNTTAAGTFGVSATGIGTGYRNQMAIGRNNAATSTGLIYAGQIIESTNVLDLAGSSVTLSFVARAGANFSASGSLINVEIWSGTGTDQGLSSLQAGNWTTQTQFVNQSQAITTTNTRYTFTGTVPSGAKELAIYIRYTPVGTAGADDNLYFTNVQLEKGTVASSFDFRPYSTELQLCQRYYAKAVKGSYPGSFAAYAFSTASFTASLQFPITMRATPTLTYYYNGTANAVGNVGTAGSVSISVAQNWWTADGVLGANVTGGPFTTGASYGFDYTASAEL
jgi:hypothetical protein